MNISCSGRRGFRSEIFRVSCKARSGAQTVESDRIVASQDVQMHKIVPLECNVTRAAGVCSDDICNSLHAQACYVCTQAMKTPTGT